jgi:hypothetical protein
VTPRDDRPSLGIVVVAGIGVLAVLGFVAAVALGGHTVERPGDRVAVVAGSGPAGATVLAARCLDERVTRITVSPVPSTGAPASGVSAPSWEIRSVKGSIERSYALGGSPPDGFTTVTPFDGATGRVEVAVTFDRFEDGSTLDARTVDLAHLPAASSERLSSAAPAPCGGRTNLGFTNVLFALGALVVVLTYVGIIRKRWAR